MRAIAYWAPKSSAALHEWEDGCGYDLDVGRAVVADGASTSFAAQQWARALVRAFLEAPPRTVDPEAFGGWLRSVANSWADEFEVGAIDADQWYVGEAANRGGFATFCGVTIAGGPEQGTPLVYRCFAVGDSCLFHVRDAALVEAFPLDDADAFDDAPALVTTLPHRGDHGERHLRISTGTLEADDVLLLATDALAAWALRRSVTVGDAWRLLSAIDRDGFAELIARGRSRGELVDDDTTLVRWQVGTE